MFAVKIPEVTGSFKRFCEVLGGINITEFNYRFANAEQAYVFVGVKLKRGLEEYAELTATLAQNGLIHALINTHPVRCIVIRHILLAHIFLSRSVPFANKVLALK